ncbi:MAG: winged helix-turn-helix transcriptional regulator [Betaproteobacteria bacterium]|nr:MarR family winged helix-turn-helix transcriptional regulator [Betaproteobacteria bacterium]MBU6513343.1 MarR family winged helix-turn-helix transcriptional regulator [Betaproteobacteria bacterium]MDE1956164.1 winged helix-turn-helix transcriptional regulator [Betaproteobacteria bacterium]MDE2151790.1 winged helix-turn-helix transcriptional regulator [Betaproteobacteria bacterium]MDE2478456.1 winged helix-turn-helix transcriptional regulator [Betaproteobacteria bacterium]
MSPEIRRLRNPENLDDLLNYRLFRLYASATSPVTRLMEGKWGISRREWRLLGALAAVEQTSPSELAEQTHLDRPRTSRAIASLVAKKLAQRTVTADDARRATVSLTPTGRALFEEVFPQIARLNTRLLEAIDDELATALDRALRALTVRADELGISTEPEVRANRRAGGSRRVRPIPGDPY